MLEAHVLKIFSYYVNDFLRGPTRVNSVATTIPFSYWLEICNSIFARL